MCSKTRNGVSALEDEVVIDAAGQEIQKREKRHLHEVKAWDEKIHEVVGSHASERRQELGCTYPSKRTVPVC